MNPIRGFKDGWYLRYSRVDRRPSALWSWPARFLPAAQRAEIMRRVRSLQLPVDPLESADPPSIEVLLVTTRKDFPTLVHAASSTIKHSRNPVSRIVLVTPEGDVEDARALMQELALPVETLVLSEDAVLNEQARTRLREHFGWRYGWVLQQFLCLAYTITSEAPGVLILDSDTVLSRDRLFFDGRRQILMPTLEHHAPYYVFLRNVNPLFGTETNSYVSHHMLWQPSILCELLQIVCDGDLGILAKYATQYADMETASPFCVDYELYAQGIMAVHPELVALAKWANSPAGREDLSTDLERHPGYSRFASVSFHSFL
ncbi:MAG TPA: hypothetical protein DDY88_05050 [Actinobacteria bacterium]|nr:hypothetical protein [Actinomycetota bacterium]